MLNFLFTRTPLVFLTQSLWRDEAFSYFLAKKNILEIIVLSAKDFTPPLYYLLLHYWLKIFGSTEISLRSLSLVFYWAMLYVCYEFLKDIFKLNKNKSSLYMLLFLVNPFLLYFAFEARGYTLLAFLATLSYYSFYKKNYKLYFFATLFGLYTHYFMIFVVLSQLLFNYLTRKKGLIYQKINRIIFKPLIFFLPWLIFVLFEKNFFTASFWLQKINLKTIPDLLGIIYLGYDNGMTFYSQRISWASLAILLLLVVAFASRHKIKFSDPLYLYLSLWAIGIPLFVILISFIKPIFLPRYFIFSSVGFILFLIYILDRLKPRLGLLVLLFMIIIALDFHKLQIRHRKKRDLQKTLNEVKALSGREDVLYVTSELDYFTAQYYLERRASFGNINSKKIYIFNKQYEEIPDFVGKVLISNKNMAATLPFYPERAFVLNSDGSYNIQALY